MDVHGLLIIQTFHKDNKADSEIRTPCKSMTLCSVEALLTRHLGYCIVNTDCMSKPCAFYYGKELEMNVMALAAVSANRAGGN